MILLDTHIWHWWTNQIQDKLSTTTIALIEETDEVAVSAISCFEMAWLHTHGRIDLGMTVDAWLAEVQASQTVVFLPVTPWIATRSVMLPEHHKDPQDRIIIATALAHRARLLSVDGNFPKYQELAGLLIDCKYSPQRKPGSARGKLTIISDDDEHLDDFEDMP